jgi:23S rRNA (pseudouridine1915-N3)-methyltransferase
MKNYLISVSHKQPDWIEKGFDEYQKRLPKEWVLHLIDIKPQPATQSSESMKQKEGEKIIAHIPKQASLWVLDEKGSLWDSQNLCQEIQKQQHLGQDICWVIGGADGLSTEVKNLASQKIALSRLTLPHGLVRVLLCEQIYRAYSLAKGHPYHRA